MQYVAAIPARWAHRSLALAQTRLTEAVGGPARRRAVLVLGAANAVVAADVGVVGAIAAQLEGAFRVGTTDIGLLVTVSSLVAAVGTVPAGVLADRVPRVGILQWGVLVWGGAEIVSGLSTSFVMLLVVRVALGLFTAAEPPAVVSLTGDLFPAGERARLLGFILGGEIVGTGAGVLLATLVSSFAGWRGAFIVLAVPSPVLWLVLRRLLPEPARGGQSWLQPGDDEMKPAEEVEDEPVEMAADEEERAEIVVEQVEAAGVEPDEENIPDDPPERMGLWAAVRYVLRVRTNVLLIVSSALGYFFFGGLRTFGLLYIRGRFGIGQGTATLLVIVIGLGTLVGVLSGGRLADRLVRRGRYTARIWVAALGYLAAAAILVPGILAATLAAALPLFVVAGVALSAPNPPLDAARLDVVGSALWGRAEGVRSFMRSTLEAFAPLLFGFVASVWGAGPASFGGGINARHVAVSAGQTHGLELAFLVMLAPLAAGGLLLVWGRRSYPADVASAAEFDRRTGHSPESPRSEVDGSTDTTRPATAVGR